MRLLRLDSCPPPGGAAGPPHRHHPVSPPRAEEEKQAGDVSRRQNQSKLSQPDKIWRSDVCSQLELFGILGTIFQRVKFRFKNVE